MDYGLELLLSLDGYTFDFDYGYRVKLEARLVKADQNRPHGLKYSLTFHDPDGERIYGMDNAHGIGQRVEFDHRHVDGAQKIVSYTFETPAQLLEDFYREVNRIRREKGVT